MYQAKGKRILLLLAILLLSSGLAANARDPWEINYPTPAPTAPVGGQPFLPGFVPKVGPNFWQGGPSAVGLGNRVPVGTLLTGVLQNDLSSKKTKGGETFQIDLTQGYSSGGNILIPPNSIIVGKVVTAQSAATFKAGHPGQLQVALQSLNLPDGRSMPIYGFIDRNPNQQLASNKPLKVHPHGQSISDYPQTLSSFFGSFTAGLGRSMNARNRGQEFKLEAGSTIDVRLNRSLDIAPGNFPNAASGMPGSMPPFQIAGQQSIYSPQMAQQQAMQPQQFPQQAGFQPQQQGIPGLQGPDPDNDGNAVFNQPVHPRPVADMPNPF